MRCGNKLTKKVTTRPSNDNIKIYFIENTCCCIEYLPLGPAAEVTAK